MEPVKISVYGIVGNSLCVSAKDGEKVYKKIREVLEKGKKVELSFLNVQLLTAAFFKYSNWKLYWDFSEEKIKNSLFLRNISAARINNIAKEKLDLTAELEAVFTGLIIE